MATRRQKKKRERVSARRRIETRQSRGSGSKYLQLPEGYTQFQPKEGKYRVDFMSYRVGKGNPFADLGEVHYERTFWIHKDIGPNKDWHLCAAKTFDQPCPICEYRGALAKDPDSDEKLIKELYPKERQLWLPVNLDSDEDEEKLIWDWSVHCFGGDMDEKIDNSDEEDEYQFFADPETGQTVRLVFGKKATKGYSWLTVVDFEFKARREQYDESICDEVPCLDDLLVATPYDKLKALFLQTDEANNDDDDEPEKKTSRRKKPKKDPEPEPEPEEDDGPEPESEEDDIPFDDDSEQEGGPEDDEAMTAEDAGLEEGDKVVFPNDDDSIGECEIIRISGDGTSLTLEDADGDIHKGIGCEEVEKVEPKKKTTKKPPAKKAPPKSKPKRKPAKKKAPEEEPAEEDDAGGGDKEWDEDW